MESVKKQYISEMKSQFSRYNVTWAPGVPLQVGDIGVFDKDGAFDRKSKTSKIWKLLLKFAPTTLTTNWITVQEAVRQLPQSYRAKSHHKAAYWKHSMQV